MNHTYGLFLLCKMPVNYLETDKSFGQFRTFICVFARMDIFWWIVYLDYIYFLNNVWKISSSTGKIIITKDKLKYFQYAKRMLNVFKIVKIRLCWWSCPVVNFQSIPFLNFYIVSGFYKLYLEKGFPVFSQVTKIKITFFYATH